MNTIAVTIVTVHARLDAPGNNITEFPVVFRSHTQAIAFARKYGAEGTMTTDFIYDTVTQAEKDFYGNGYLIVDSAGHPYPVPEEDACGAPECNVWTRP